MQCSSLIDKRSKDDFLEDVNDEYEDIRTEHYDTLKVVTVYSDLVFL